MLRWRTQLCCVAPSRCLPRPTHTPHATGATRRLYYLALPPSVYPQVCAGLKAHCDKLPAGPGWIRVVVEKPFGKDLETSEALAAELGALYPER